MELTDELKEKLLKCESRVQADELLAKAEVHLSDDELDAVAGGWGVRDGDVRALVEEEKLRRKYGLPPKPFY